MAEGLCSPNFLANAAGIKSILENNYSELTCLDDPFMTKCREQILQHENVLKYPENGLFWRNRQKPLYTCGFTSKCYFGVKSCILGCCRVVDRSCGHSVTMARNVTVN